MQSDRLGAHIPWVQVEHHLDQVISLGLTPEFAFKGPDLDQLDPSLISSVFGRLDTAGLRPTVHAPFFDLNPGALDPLVREVTARRLNQGLDVTAQLNGHTLIIHPGYDRWRYPGLAAAWTENAAAFFRPLVARAAQAGCRLALENIYEQTPQTLCGLVDALASPWFGHCFDAGHWQLFGTTPMVAWLEAVGPKLFHLHLHDNLGVRDDHLPVGDGNIDFPRLLGAVDGLADRPSMTLEAHSPKALQRSLQAVRALLAPSPS